MIRKIFSAAFACVAIQAVAQDRLPDYDRARLFTPDKVEFKMFSYYIRPNYFKDSSDFWYEFKTTKGTEWKVVKPATASKTLLFDNDEMAAQLTLLTGDPYDGQHLPIEQLRLRDDNKTFTFRLKKKDYEFTYGTALKVKEAKPEERRKMEFGNVSPDSTQVVYAKDYNLYTLSYGEYKKLLDNPKDSTIQETKLTTTGVKDFSFGGYQAGSRSRTSGYWSPDGKYYIQLVRDQRMIKDLWVINSIAEPRPTLETYKYQMPGEPGAETHMYVFDVQAKKVKEVDLKGTPQQMVSLVRGRAAGMQNKIPSNTWEGDKDFCYLIRRSRDLKNYDVCTYTMGQDSIVPVLQETMNTYIDSKSMIVLNGGKQFLHWSERDGWAHLYLYNKDGSLASRLTKGPWHVDEVRAVDPVKKVVYFIGNGREKTDQDVYFEHLYRVNFDGSGLTCVTPGNFNHSPFMDERQGYVVDNFSRVNTVPEICLYNNMGKKIMDLEKADMSEYFAMGYQFPEPFVCKAADGVTDIYGNIYRPFNMDTTKVYPVINYCYPGPQEEGCVHSFMPMSPRHDRLAQAGFIVITAGQRGGHPSRSKWYHNYGYGNLRDYPLADRKAVTEQLCAKYKYMDINNVGITGHSGGGFMSTAAILQYPDFFKAAVSCSGNHDNNIYNTMWSERHHGVTARMDDKGEMHFDIHVPVNQELAKNLKGHLLLIHGDVDNNVHPANTIRVVNELIKAGKRFEMLIMPGKQHQYEYFNEYFYWKMVDFFSEHLKGQKETSVDIPGMVLGNWFRGGSNAIR